MKKQLINFGVIIFFATVILFTACLKDKQTGEPSIGAEVGQTLPGFSLPDRNRDLVTNSDVSGKIVLIEFWATWCSYCSAEEDDLQALYSDFKEKNFDVVGISLDKDHESWFYKVAAQNSYTQLIGENGFESEFAVACNVQSIPKMILIDGDGVVLLVTTRTKNVREYLNNYLN